MKRNGDGLQVPVRVDKDHPLIGKYVIEITNPISADDAFRITCSMNAMVFQREQAILRFCRICIDEEGGKYIVARKLLEGDQESFISDNLIVLGGDNEWWETKPNEEGIDTKVVSSSGVQKDTN